MDRIYIASNGRGREIKVKAISATKAIFTAAKIFRVKANKVSVREAK